MKILVIGNGGREHTLVWKLVNDSCKPEVFCAPGNAGTAEIAVNLDIRAEDIDGLIAWAVENRPDLTVVGPEAPLCAGVTDRLQEHGLRVFGPTKEGARLEGSKQFSKEVMNAAGVPTARSKSFSHAEEAIEYIRRQACALVVKADGLAAGKGVFVCATPEEAGAAVNTIMIDKSFGESGDLLIVEEYLAGEEASILALVDGKNVVMLASSQDHKRVYNNDGGPNTGGMGAYSPAPVVTDELWPIIKEQVFDRMIAELNRRGIVYKGVLYAGLMISDSGVKVLEFNCRFGDPETQVVIPRIDGDLLPALEACVDGCLHEGLIKWKDESCVCVVMASGGYPGPYEKGKVIEGLRKIKDMNNVIVFHAGTKISGSDIVTAGGRVLGITALGENLAVAIKSAYLAISGIRFDQAQYRTDIGVKAIKRLKCK